MIGIQVSNATRRGQGAVLKCQWTHSAGHGTGTGIQTTATSTHGRRHARKRATQHIHRLRNSGFAIQQTYPSLTADGGTDSSLAISRCVDLREELPVHDAHASLGGRQDLARRENQR